MLEKEQVQVIFLFKLKMDHKAAETTHNINTTFGPGTTNKWTVQCWFKKFCKGNESLEDKEGSGQSWEGRSDKLRATTKPDPRTITQEVADELNVDPTAVIRHLKQIGKLKLNKRVPHELTEKKKNHFQLSSSLIPHNNDKSFLDRIVIRYKKWIFCDNHR